MDRDETIREARKVAAGLQPPPAPYCVEYDSALCAEPADCVVVDIVTGTMGPHCAKCGGYYAHDLVRPLPEGSPMAREIGLKQLLIRLLIAVGADT